MTKDEIRDALSNIGTVFAAGPTGLVALNFAQDKIPIPWLLIQITIWLIPVGVIIKCCPALWASVIYRWLHGPLPPGGPPSGMTPLLVCGCACLLLLAGCITVSTPQGGRIFATGNAKVSISPEGTVTIENSGTAETYQALGQVIGKLAEGAAKGASPAP